MLSRNINQDTQKTTQNKLVIDYQKKPETLNGLYTDI